MSISENIKTIRTKIITEAKKCGCTPESINLVAVSKTQSEEKITEILNTGHRLFGENRVQEAQERWEHRRKAYPDLRLHLIGPLQTNKVKQAVALFDVIETLDREKLARALCAEMKQQKRYLTCFIQVNTGAEEQKAGIALSDLSAFFMFCKKECDLNVAGLMCIPPINDPPALHFALLNKYAVELGLSHLSMGMSADFEKAIPLGATYIRIGTGIFGQRT